MHTTDQLGLLGKACPAPWPVSWPEEPAPRNPQASYYGARYYDPTPGRFISEDPISFDGEPTSIPMLRTNPLIIATHNSSGAVAARYKDTQNSDEDLSMQRANARTWGICGTRALGEGFRRGVCLREAGNRPESGYATISALEPSYELCCPCEGISSEVPHGRARNCRIARRPLDHLRQCGR